MKVTVWGARGSIPVSGPQYVKYGGDTTCLGVETAEGELIVLDVGTGLRPLGTKLIADGVKRIHLLLTHAHWDHLLGFPFFKPLYRKDFSLIFHGCTFAQASIQTFFKETMRAPFFPVDFGDVAATLEFDENCPEQFTVAGVECQSFPMNHPNEGYGFLLSEGSSSMAFFPDNELMFHHPGGRSFEEYVEFVRGVDVLFHDGEYLPAEYEAYSRGWGHSVYLDTVRLGIEAGVKRLVLWHLNQDRTDEQVDGILHHAREAVAAAGSTMACDMAYTGMALNI